MSAPKNISLRIPASVKWSEEDLIDKAEKHGMNKSEFMIMAIDTFMGFDDDFIKMMQDRTLGLHVPLHVAIQNTIIAQFAREKARRIFEDKTYGVVDASINIQRMDEFAMISDASGWHMLTGKALEEYLIDLYVKEFEQAKKDQNAAD